MKLYSTNRINALGLIGPEETCKHFPQATSLEVDNDNIQESEKILYEKAQQIFRNQKREIRKQHFNQQPTTNNQQPREKPIVFLGGDHSITYPLVKAFKEKKQNPFLIIFDAHPDCMPPTQEPTHEEFLAALIEKGFPSKKIILIGIRKTEPEEKAFLEKHNIKVFNPEDNINTIIKYIEKKTKNHEVYLSIDIDALDPSEAPAVNYPEPNGLAKEKFFKILSGILKTKTLKAVDIVEAIPKKDKPYSYKTLNLIKKIVEQF